MELLDLLIEQAPSVPLLVLATLRPEQTPAEWMRREYVDQVTLDRLDRKETIEMVLAVTGGKPLPAVVLEEIATRTDGVPLFVEDLTRMVIESDMVVEREDYYDLARPLPVAHHSGHDARHHPGPLRQADHGQAHRPGRGHDRPRVLHRDAARGQRRRRTGAASRS